MSETNQSRNAAVVAVVVISGLARLKSDEEIAEEASGSQGIEDCFGEAIW